MSRIALDSNAGLTPANALITLAGFPTEVGYNDGWDNWVYRMSDINGNHTVPAGTVEWWGARPGWIKSGAASISVSYNGGAFFPLSLSTYSIWLAWTDVNSLYGWAAVVPDGSTYGYSHGNLFNKACATAAAAIGGGFAPQYGPYLYTTPASPWGSFTLDGWS